MKIKALSLIQPWALLIFAPEPWRKHYETRNWYTSYRGTLAIHASGRASFDRTNSDLHCRTFPFDKALARLGLDPTDLSFSAIPFGAVIGVVDLVDCIGTDSTRGQKAMRALPPGSPETAFGDFSEGRFMWQCANPVRFAKPIPARGSLNLWDWEVPEGVQL